MNLVRSNSYNVTHSLFCAQALIYSCDLLYVVCFKCTAIIACDSILPVVAHYYFEADISGTTCARTCWLIFYCYTFTFWKIILHVVIILFAKTLDVKFSKIS